MANEWINPHRMGMHSAACTGEGELCAVGLTINWQKGFMLNTNEKVIAAMEIRSILHIDFSDEWKLGDTCWYKPDLQLVLKKLQEHA